VNIVDLSGGNQQKVLIARAFASEAGVLLLDDPTRGVDVATKTAVYRVLQEARSEGRTIIVYSTEDAEFDYCDRVYVFAQGRISGELIGAQISGPEIIRLSYAVLTGAGAVRAGAEAATSSPDGARAAGDRAQ
jgi:ribose transport system ATP-binding protein